MLAISLYVYTWGVAFWAAKDLNLYGIIRTASGDGGTGQFLTAGDTILHEESIIECGGMLISGEIWTRGIINGHAWLSCGKFFVV